MASDVLPRAARECYKWLLCPVQQAPIEAKTTVEAFPLNTAGSALGSEIERVCIENELVITTWSPIHLRTSLKDLYWKADKPAFGALAFWEDTQRYFYLPRLKTREVLAQAIIKGAASKEFFGTAYAQTGDTFEGFKLGDSNVQLDDTLLLIEPEVAKQYEGKIKSAPPPPPAGATTPGTGTTPAGGPGTPAGTGGTTPGLPGLTPKAHSFHGTAEVNAAAAKVRLTELADEIISLLVSDPNATVKVTVEIDTEFPNGASDQIRRAVSENANSLALKNKTWE